MGGPDVSRFRATSVTARALIEFAYDIRDFQFVGGPGWVDSKTFDLDATVEDSLAERLRKLPHAEQQQQMRLMLQSLLADRFSLKITHSSRVMPIFALVVAKGGAKVTRAAPPTPESSVPFPAPPSPDQPALAPGGTLISLLPGGRATITGKSAPISALADMLGALLGRQVTDQTGLHGTYDFLVSYARDPGLEGSLPASSDGTPSSADRSGVSLFTALQEQLGLRLEASRGPVHIIIVDHIEEPSPN